MTSPRNLTCSREKNACYSVLILLLLLSVVMFGISFVPKLKESTTRVYLWVLSCSIFIITSTTVLFLWSFCFSCNGCRGGEEVWQDVEGNGSKDTTSASSTATGDTLRMANIQPKPKPRPELDMEESELETIEEEDSQTKSINTSVQPTITASPTAVLAKCDILEPTTTPPPVPRIPAILEDEAETGLFDISEGSEENRSSEDTSPPLEAPGSFEDNSTRSPEKAFGFFSTPIMPAGIHSHESLARRLTPAAAGGFDGEKVTEVSLTSPKKEERLWEFEKNWS